MKQVVFHFQRGAVRLVDVPPPALLTHAVRVRTEASVVSPGTERLLLTLARRSLVGKAADRPDLVARVWRKLRRDGLLAAVRTVRDRMGAPVPLGYSAAGVVTDVGEGLEGPGRAPGGPGPVVVGDRVACAGAGAANHAEEIVVPRTLVARVPAGVATSDAAFATLGAIALNAVRAADVRLGDRVAVIGVGLLGTLALRILRAAGARVLAVDPHPDRRARAAADGAEAVAGPDVASAAGRAFTAGVGVDAVIVAAASGGDASPMSLAADLVRRAGVVVALGDVPVSVPRRLAYAKEATVRVATSYGPGRYDRAYERAGRDYPLPYVRWTAGRNLEAFLGLLASSRVVVSDLAEDVPLDQAVEVYERLLAGAGGAAGGDGRVARFVYPRTAPEPVAAPIGPKGDARPGAAARSGALRAALVGAGAFARGTLWPALASAGLTPATVVAATGASADFTAKRAGFSVAATDAQAAAAASDVDVVVVATPHDDHAALACAALAAGKHVFVEKPLATDRAGLASVEAALVGSKGLLAVGHNRRFADATRRLRTFFEGLPGPSLCVYRVNAGPAPDEGWHGDASVSGGRIVGEVCHMVDLLVAITGEVPTRVAAVGTRGPLGSGSDDAILSLEFSGGSVATIAYHAMGDPTAGKERLEVVRGDRAALLDDFRALTLRVGGKVTRRRLSGDKGHAACARAFVDAVRAGGPPPVPYAEVLAVARATLSARRALVSGRFERVG